MLQDDAMAHSSAEARLEHAFQSVFRGPEGHRLLFDSRIAELQFLATAQEEARLRSEKFGSKEKEAAKKWFKKFLKSKISLDELADTRLGLWSEDADQPEVWARVASASSSTSQCSSRSSHPPDFRSENRPMPAETARAVPAPALSVAASRPGQSIAADTSHIARVESHARAVEAVREAVSDEPGAGEDLELRSDFGGQQLPSIPLSNSPMRTPSMDEAQYIIPPPSVPTPQFEEPEKALAAQEDLQQVRSPPRNCQNVAQKPPGGRVGKIIL